MEISSLPKVPVQLQVSDLINSRYNPEGGDFQNDSRESNKRPSSWDLRKAGVDIVRTQDGQILKLFSDGGQSPPQRGSVLVIMGGDSEQGYTWTLYGLPPS